MTLCRCYGNRQHDLDVAQRSTRACQQAVLDVEHHLTLNDEVVVEDQGILGEVDGAFDGVLDGDETDVDLPTIDRVQNIGNGTQGNSLEPCQIGLGEEGLFGERAGWTKEADATCFRHPDKARSGS